MQNKKPSFLWLLDLFLILAVLAGGWYLRQVGLANWDNNQHLHPDERFMTMVSSALSPVNGFSEYFHTETSSLNPNNRGFDFYVYGTLPIFIVRYVGELVQQTGYDEIAVVGRQVSALMDLGAVFLLYLIVLRLYGRRAALLAAAFSAVAVMQIQQSHFFTVDNFATFFMTLAVFFAVELVSGESSQHDKPWWRSPLLWNTIGFGLATGMSVASKLNAAPVAVLLPLALGIRYWREHKAAQAASAVPALEEETPGSEEAFEPAVAAGEPPATDEAPVPAANPVLAPRRIPALSLEMGLALLLVGAFATLLAFRIFQPYAFSGPGFFGVTPNPKWVATIAEQRAQASGDADFPPALQWARRSVTFSGYNLTAWGLGWPLGILAWAGFLFMGWRILRGEWREHLLLWLWVLAYFAWQSAEWNPTMRYQLPIYPLLALMAGWFVFHAFQNRNRWLRLALYGVGLGVLVATAAYAFGFTRIYTRDHTRVAATRWLIQNAPGAVNLLVQQPDGALTQQPLAVGANLSIQPGAPLVTRFTALAGGPLHAIRVGRVIDSQNTGTQTLMATLASEDGFVSDAILAQATLDADFSAPRAGYEIIFSAPVTLEAGRNYDLRLEATAFLNINGASLVNESSWDDGLPLRMDGYDPFGGIYQGDLNFEMYWDENADKLHRFVTNLDNGDFIIISSNRQWGTTVRVPERYPLTTTYYRALLGCPAAKDILWCYSVARPGDFTGRLGYELVQVFESYPTLGSWELNTQFAEEAFTVYDHPKVLIFKKSANYDPNTVRTIFAEVDLSKVVRLTPRQSSRFPSGQMTPLTCFGSPALCDALGAPEAAQVIRQGNLSTHASGMQLSAEKLAVQQAGGTWSQLFSYEALQNRYPLLGLLLWYGFLLLLGLAMYPLLRLALPGLADKGYAFGRFGGLVLFGYLPWLFASTGGVYTRPVILLAFGLIVATGAALAWFQRDQIREEIRARGKLLVLIELVFLAFFVIDLLIRLGNPDLWHPSKGGERPMDFSYFNAVLKSTTFPPYDPWFAGGSLNYYYYGYVLVGTPVKLLGIVPSIAYNFILPSLFAMLAIGAFSIGWTLLQATRPQWADVDFARPFGMPFWAGISGAVSMVLLGNLATVRMVYHALQKMAVSQEQFESAEVWFFQRWVWMFQGFAKYLGGDSLPLNPIGSGSWYWDPSRVMPPGDPAITEFPLFTFLYSDLHAHMIAMPITVLVLAWAVSALLARRMSLAQWTLSLAFGGLALGALRPTNTWDMPTYLVFAALSCSYAIFRYTELPERAPFGLPPVLLRILLALAGMAALTGFAFAFYQPFARWFGLGYSEVTRWEYQKSPFWSYWTHWGLFLFILLFWLGWETRQWLEQTPLSALRRFQPYAGQIRALALFFVFGVLGAVVFLMYSWEIQIAWFALPVMLWALILMLRPRQPDSKRIVLFMVATALALTLGVEIVVISSDRMNTVFKFYIQAWILFAISAGAAIAWTLSEIDEWSSFWRNTWNTGVAVLLASAFMFTLTASTDKIRDRMSQDVPFTFDTMEFMAYSTYWDVGEMQLREDYNAIRWLQQKSQGSAVIVEGHATEYKWGSRYTMYTGLPGVVGWNWHQRQQRALTPDTWVFDRVNAIAEFYNTEDLSFVVDFISKHKVRYIIVGQMERQYYQASPGGLSKFENLNGIVWQEIYRDGQTVIYEVK